MEIFHQIFKGVTSLELAEACEPAPQPVGQPPRGQAGRIPGSAGFAAACALCANPKYK